VKRRNYQFVVQFLRQEERVGNLRLEAVDE